MHIMFLEDCYSIDFYENNFNYAQYNCSKDGGSLLKLETDLHMLFLTEFLKDETTIDYVWTAFRKDPSPLTDNPDKLYNVHTFEEVEIEISTGKLLVQNYRKTFL